MLGSPAWAAHCGSKTDDQKRLTISGTVDVIYDDKVDGKGYTYVSIADCDLEISLARTKQCKKGDQISATGTFWVCGDNGSYADGVECDWEDALEAEKFSCSR